MGESSFSCHPPSEEGCCLSLPETIILLVALTIVVQLVLKLASVICYYLWYLVGVLFGMVVVQATAKPKHSTSKAKKMYALKAKPSACWSYLDVPRRSRRKESRSPSRRCLHCTLEPLKVTMNLQNEGAPHRAGRRPYPDYPPYLPPQYYNYEYESRPRPRRASAPSAYAVTRYRDAVVGSSDPILRASRSNTPERRTTATGTELVPRHRAREAQHRAVGSGPDAEHPGITSRSRRPAKVYIYPVHPQTPPESRSSSPERPRHRRRRKAITTSQEEHSEPEPRASRRKAREAEQQTSGPTLLHHHGGNTDIAQGQAQTESPAGKPRYYWSDQVSGADWVYRPVK